MISSTEEFVLKLPAARVDTLEATGLGKRFQAGKGRPIREWRAVHAAADLDRIELAREALEFVRTVP
jgi:hypothetical protein